MEFSNGVTQMVTKYIKKIFYFFSQWGGMDQICSKIPSPSNQDGSYQEE